jgi:Fe-S-cluster containining protein
MLSERRVLPHAQHDSHDASGSGRDSRAVPESDHLKWRVHEEGWMHLVAAPCPLLVDNQCSVYAVRPFVCRRFQCHRAAGEAFDPSGPFGCGTSAIGSSNPE